MQELEAVKKELADISAFVREKVAPAQEERERLREAVEGVAQAGRDVRRRALMGQEATAYDPAPSGPGNAWGRHAWAAPRQRAVVDSPGRYAGCDALDMAIVRSLFRAAQANGGGPALEEWGVRLKAAMDSLTAGSGDELVPQAEAREMWLDMNSQTMVASQFSRVTMPTNPFDIPLQLGDVNWYPAEENVSARPTALTTGKRTLTAYELAAEVPWSLTLEEDSIVAMLPEVRRTLVRNAAEVVDDVLLNGDTTAVNGINSDGAAITASTPGKAQWLVGFDGLLHLPLVDNTSQSNDLNGGVTAAAYNQALRMLGRYGVRPRESVFITDINTFLASLAIEEVETVDRLGPHASLLTGQLGVVYGHPLIVSEQMRLADTDGKVTDAGNGTDTGRILAVNTSQWRVGFRRELSIETERDIQKRQNVMVVSMRIAFAERTGSRPAARHTALQYDITGVA